MWIFLKLWPVKVVHNYILSEVIKMCYVSHMAVIYVMSYVFIVNLLSNIISTCN